MLPCDRRLGLRESEVKGSFVLVGTRGRSEQSELLREKEGLVLHDKLEQEKEWVRLPSGPEYGQGKGSPNRNGRLNTRMKSRVTVSTLALWVTHTQ